MLRETHSKKGFTLIELLVVVSIISLLSSVVFAALNSARGKARDAKRAEDVHQLKTALEFYYDANGVYPSIGGDGSGYQLSGGLLTAPLSPYIKQIPDDPLPADPWWYVRGPAATNSYGLLVWDEKLNAYCGSGVNWANGWWGLPSANCPF